MMPQGVRVFYIYLACKTTEDMLNLLKEQVTKELGPKEIIITEIGCTIGTHAGPGTLAIFYAM